MKGEDDILVRVMLSDYLLSFMFLRFIFLFRTIFNNSIYRNQYSKRVCKHYGVSSGARFTFRVILDQYPEATIGWLFCVTIILFSYILRVLETPYQFHQDKTYFNKSIVLQLFDTVYFVIVTITTVGYGDMAPSVFVSKLCVICLTVLGSFLMSLVILIVMNVFKLQKN